MKKTIQDNIDLEENYCLKNHDLFWTPHGWTPNGKIAIKMVLTTANTLANHFTFKYPQDNFGFEVIHLSVAAGNSVNPGSIN